MILKTEKIVPRGDCLARLEGKAVFVPGALPGETLEVELTQEKRDYSRARVIRVLEASPRRVDPVCLRYGQCGGCNLQHADYAYQVELKKAMLTDAFARSGFGRTGEALPEIRAVAGKPWEYRSRIQLHRGPGVDGTAAIGFMARPNAPVTGAGGVPIIPLEDCPALTPVLRRFLAALSGESAAQSPRTLLTACFAEKAGPTGAEIAASDRYAGKVYAEVLGRRIYFHPAGFFQSNIPALEGLILELADSFPLCGSKENRTAALADLYAGCGVFAAFLAEKFAGPVALVEENPVTLGAAEGNLPSGKAHFFQASCAAWTRSKAARRRYAAVVADPPRKGLEKETLAWLCESPVEEFRYVSCDPVTLARDSAVLARGGFRLQTLTLHDFYPQTSHVETLAVFSRESAARTPCQV